MRSRFALPIALLAALVACSNLTKPTGAKAHRAECVTRDITEDCDRTPFVDSISPSVGFPTQPATFVCVYGVNLAGGTVLFDGKDVATDSPGCGALVFTAPGGPPATHTVEVRTQFGISNAVTFTRE